jgi:hypothetical protein
LDAADSSTVTGTTTVTAWRDKSTKAYTLAPGSGTTSYASSAITLSTSYLLATGAVDLTTFTFFVVVKNNNTNTNIPLFAARPNTSTSYNSTDGFGFYLDGQTQTRFYGGYPTAGQSITTTGLTTSTATLFSVTGTSAGVFQQWNNGAIGGTATYTTRTSTAQGFSVGGEWSGSSYTTYSSSSSIYEVLVFNSVLSTSQRQSIENYLMRKWGISNITTHPFKNIPPSTSQPPQFQEVTPGNWTYDWQPYLKSLTAANSGATANTPVLTTKTGSYYGGVLAPNGNIYCAPQNTSNILVITPTTTSPYCTFTTISVVAGYYTGGVLAPNGLIYFIPGNSANGSIIVFNPTLGTYTTVSITAGNYGGGVLAPNGLIYCPPYASTTNILVITPTATSCTAAVVGSGLGRYFGACLAPNGNIYCTPLGAGNILVITPTATSCTYTTIGTGLGSYAGAILAPNGFIYSVGPNILVIFPTTGTYTTAATGGNYFNGALGPDGKIYFMPQGSGNILVVTPTSTSPYATTSTLGSGLSTAMGAVLAPNGTIYGVTDNASIIAITFTGLAQTPSSNYCLSAWANKF